MECLRRNGAREPKLHLGSYGLDAGERGRVWWKKREDFDAEDTEAQRSLSKDRPRRAELVGKTRAPNVVACKGGSRAPAVQKGWCIIWCPGKSGNTHS